MKRLFALAAALVLAGCATLPGGEPADRAVPAGWQERQALLERIDRFTLQARIAGSGNVAMKGDLRWQQRADGSFDLRLAGPFGAGAIGIAGDARSVQVRSRDGSEFTTDPERWLQQRTGWTLPIAGLRYWMLGLPAPHSASQPQFNAAGGLAALDQDGWHLQYEEYQAVGTLNLPRRLRLQNEVATIKVIADRWEDLPAPTP